MSGLLLGAVAYDPKVVTIWAGFRSWLRGRGLEFDYVLYSNYEKQVTDLIAGRIDLAWNSSLAWVRASRLAAAAAVALTPVAMRDTDCDLRSLVVVRADSPVRSLADLRGRIVATGAIDSPQSTLLPLSLLRAAGLRPGTETGSRANADVWVRRFDVGVGLHGDHIGGERDAARALFAGDPAERVDAACVVDSNLPFFVREGTLRSGSVRVIAQTPPYDHRTMTAGPAVTEAAAGKITNLLRGMDHEDPALRPLLAMEGLKEWRPPRLSGYPQLERAVDETGFYDPRGEIGAGEYRP